MYEGMWDDMLAGRPLHPNCLCVPTPVPAEPIPLPQDLPTHVVFCRDCGTVRYGSMFVKVIRCTLCNGNNKVTARIRPL